MGDRPGPEVRADSAATTQARASASWSAERTVGDPAAAAAAAAAAEPDAATVVLLGQQQAASALSACLWTSVGRAAGGCCRAACNSWIFLG